MPTPPTYFLDYIQVGGTPTVAGFRANWGKLRSPIIVDDTVLDLGANNATYDVGFVAADRLPLFIDYVFTGPPKFMYYDFPSPPPAYGEFTIETVRVLQDRYEDQLVGETVGMTGGGFTMNSDAWSNFPLDGNQTVSSGLGSFVSVGKMYKF
jgi:hypothetical protein